MQDAGCRATHPPGGIIQLRIEFITREVLLDGPMFSFNTLNTPAEGFAQLRNARMKILEQVIVYQRARVTENLQMIFRFIS